MEKVIKIKVILKIAMTVKKITPRFITAMPTFCTVQSDHLHSYIYHSPPEEYFSFAIFICNALELAGGHSRFVACGALQRTRRTGAIKRRAEKLRSGSAERPSLTVME